MSSVARGLPGDSNSVLHTVATGPADALEPDTENALHDPSVCLIDSAIRSGWHPPSEMPVRTACRRRRDRPEAKASMPVPGIPSIALTHVTDPNVRRALPRLVTAGYPRCEGWKLDPRGVALRRHRLP
jgi:hypothetical protein